MPKLDFTGIVHEIRGRTKGHVFKKTRYSRRIILESYPKRRDPLNPESQAYHMRKNYAVADRFWQMMPRSERQEWNAAVKRPYLTGYQLWMKEAMSLFARQEFAPDHPSISGGFTTHKAIPGTKVRSCPPPGPPGNILALRAGYRRKSGSTYPGEFYMFVTRNPNATEDQLRLSQLTLVYWWYQSPWGGGWWGRGVSRADYKLDRSLWKNYYDPYEYLENDRTLFYEDITRYEDKGYFKIKRTGLPDLEGEFFRWQDWVYHE